MEITKRLALACLILLLTGLNAWSQDLFYRKNLANVKVDNLSQEQVLRFQQQIQGAKMSEQEVANYLYSKGLSREEVAKLKKRAGGLSGKDGGMSVAGNFEVLDQYFRLRDSLARTDTDSLMGIRNFGDEYVKSKEIPDSLIYGRELFANAQMRFSLDGQLPTPANYVIGPGDVLSLSLYGYQEVSTELKVLPSGQVSIPYAGMLSVAGMRIEQAAQKIGQALQQNGYASLGNGTTKLSLTVAEFRSFRVMVIGARASGNFMVPSVATVFHVLHMAGGPAKRGTYRDIEVIRKGKVVQKIDLYDFMSKGDFSNNINLQENDVINIPVYENRVQLRGEVKRPGFFELRAGESFTKLLEYAGGFTPIAYKEAIYIEQIGNNEFVSRNIEKEGFSNYVPKEADVIMVGSILHRFTERIAIGCAIKRPGYYGWENGMKLESLIKKAGGLQEYALNTRGLVYRAGKDNEKTYTRFIPEDVLSGKASLELLDGDSVVIGDKRTLFPEEVVIVKGDVNEPGSFVHGKGLSALDVVLLAGGFKRSAAPNRIEIARRIDKTDELLIAQVLEAISDEQLMLQAQEVILQPGDVVMVRPNPKYKEPITVTLSGEFTYPGPYVLLKQRELLSDVIERAGGMTELADWNAAFIVRKRFNPVYLSRIREIESKQRELRGENKPMGLQNEMPSELPPPTDTIVMDTIAIDLSAVVGKRSKKFNLQLRDGDEVILPEKRNTVMVMGEVNNKLTVNFSGKGIKPYLRDAGGTAKNADRKRIFVIEPSGKARATRQFMGIRKYPTVVPGSVVVVPSKPPRTEGGLDPAKLAAVSSILGTTATILIVITTLTGRQ